MKREIKFRGLRTKSEYHQDKWKFGNLLNDCSIGEVGYGLGSYTYAEVIPETVGQYTGLKDKNGVEIYEGDIVTNGTTEIVNYEWIYSVEYSKRHSDLNSRSIKHWEVIGNIHENKDLI